MKNEKKLRLAASLLKLHEEQMKQMANHNAMMEFMLGPGGVSSVETQEVYNLMREEALIAACVRKWKRKEKK